MRVRVVAGPAAALPALLDDAGFPAGSDGGPDARNEGCVAGSVYAAFVQVEVEFAELVLELFLHALPDFFGARVGFEEEGEFFQCAAVGLGEHEVLASVSECC